MWRMWAIGLELPTVMAISIAVAASAFAAITSRGAIYFDAVALVIALTVSSRWVFAGSVCAHVRTSTPPAANRPARSIGCVSLVARDRIRHRTAVEARRESPVPPGGAVPSDGVVVHGRSSSSQASLTGESLPVENLPCAGAHSRDQSRRAAGD